MKKIKLRVLMSESYRDAENGFKPYSLKKARADSLLGLALQKPLDVIAAVIVGAIIERNERAFIGLLVDPLRLSTDPSNRVHFFK